MTIKWKTESELAIRAATSGVNILNNAYGGYPGSGSGEASREDIAAEKSRFIEKEITSLLSASSTYPVIGGESCEQQKIDLAEPVWLVNPIDGLANYVSSIPLYAISIGMMDNLRFPVGTVIIPQQKELFYTIGNDAAYLNDKKLLVNPGSFKDALIAGTFSNEGIVNNPARQRKEYEFFGEINDLTRGCLRLGTAAVSICYVAAGRLQASYGLASRLCDVSGALAVATKTGTELYIERIDNTMLVNYVIGVSDIAEKIADMLEENGLAEFSQLNKGGLT